MFTIAADIRGAWSQIQRDSAREALFLAWSLKKEGAERISVSADDGSLMSAAALAETFRDEVGKLERRALKQALRDLDVLKEPDQPGAAETNGRAFRLT